MRNWAKWMLWIVVALQNFHATGQQENELLPQVADDGTIVWQVAQPRDLFQRVGNPFPWLPDETIGIRILFPTGPFPLGQVPDIDSYAARPQISANGLWLIYHDENGQIMLWRILLDANGNKTLASLPTQLVIRQQQVTPNGILPIIGGNGRIIAFLSQDLNLHDPDGDSDPNNNNPPNPPSPTFGWWLLYIHDRDADGDGVYDEFEEGATRTLFINVPSPNPPFIRLTEFRFNLDPTGRALAFSVFTGTAWQLWYVSDVQSPAPTLIAQSNAPFSAPSVAGSKLAFTASGPFKWGQITPPIPPLAGVHVVNMLDPNQSLAIQTNGVNGAPVLSRDGNLLAFHSTATAYRRFYIDPKDPKSGPQLEPNLRFFDFNGDNIPDDRNGVDDVFVFDLTTQPPSSPPGQPIWSTLLVRGLGTPPITLFEPCVNPALPSSNVPMIAFQQIVNGASRVRVVRSPNIVLR